MMDTLTSPYSMSIHRWCTCSLWNWKSEYIAGPIVYPIEVTLHHNSSQKLTICSESTSQCVKSGLMPYCHILSSMDDLLFKGELENALFDAVELPEAVSAAAELECIREFEGEPVVVAVFSADLVTVTFEKHPELLDAEPVEC